MRTWARSSAAKAGWPRPSVPSSRQRPPATGASCTWRSPTEALESCGGTPVAGFVTIGEVLGAHGVRGLLKVAPLTAYPERFLGLENVYLTRSPEGPPEARTVQETRIHRGVVLVKLEGVDDRESAQGLRGALLQVAK